METELSRRGFLTLPFAGLLKREQRQEERLIDLEKDVETIVTNTDFNFGLTVSTLNNLDNRVERIEDKLSKKQA